MMDLYPFEEAERIHGECLMSLPPSSTVALDSWYANARENGSSTFGMPYTSFLVVEIVAPILEGERY